MRPKFDGYTKRTPEFGVLFFVTNTDYSNARLGNTPTTSKATAAAATVNFSI